MLGRLLVEFVCLNLQFSVLWLVDFQWGSCGSIFSFLCHGRQTFSGVRVAQSLGFCGMVGRLLVSFVWLNLQSSMSWQVDFQWGSCSSIFSFLCHDWQIFSGVRVAQSLIFCVMIDRLLVGFVWFNLQFSVMVGRLLVGFVWLNLQFSVSWQVDFQWGSCGSIFSFLCHGWQTFSGIRVATSLVFYVMVCRLLMGFVWLNLQFSVSWLVDFQLGSCGSIFSFVPWQVDVQWISYGSIFSFLCHGWQTLLVGFVWLNLQSSMSWQVDFQWGSCSSIISFLCHGWQTFSGVRVAQSLIFCVMVDRLLVGFCVMVGRHSMGFVWLNQSLVFCVMVGRLLLLGFVWLNLQFSVSWQVDFQWVFVWLNLQFSAWLVDFYWGHCRQTFSGVRVAQSSVSWQVDLQWGSHGRLTFSGVRVVSVGSSMVSWLVDFQWGSCGSIFNFLCLVSGRLLVGFVWLNLQFSVSWQVRVSQSLVFCVMVGSILVGFVWLNLQFSVSWLVDFQWASCGSIFSFPCHGRQTFSGVRVAQSLVFCVMVGRHSMGFVWLNLQFSVSWLVDFQWASCG